jgi:hypothetical protein
MLPTKCHPLSLSGSYDFQREAFVGHADGDGVYLNRDLAIDAAINILKVATVFGGLSPADRDTIADLVTVKPSASARGAPY